MRRSEDTMMAKQKKNLDGIADEVLAAVLDEMMAAAFADNKLKRKLKKLLYENREVFNDGI